MDSDTSDNVPGGVRKLPSTSKIDDSIYMQVWNMIHAREEKSTEAVMGSCANMMDVLSELENKMEVEKGKPKSYGTNATPLGKRFSGINCVLEADDKQAETLSIPLQKGNMGHEFAGEQGNITYSPVGLDSGIYKDYNASGREKSLHQLHALPANIPHYRSDYKFQQPSLIQPKFKPNQEPGSSTSRTSALDKRSHATHALVPPAVQQVKSPAPGLLNPTTGDYNSNFLSQDSQNNPANRNNININLTFAMGQYQNGKQEPPPFYDVQELKAPRLRPTIRKPKKETSIQTDSDSLSDLTAAPIPYQEFAGASQIEFEGDESTSEFPSVIPSRHNYQGQRDAADRVVCIPETKTLSLNEYIDIPAVVAYTGESVKSFIETADHIINNFIIMPDDNYYSEAELEEGEGKIGISIMRLLGVPQQLRHSIYNEALHNVQALQEISTETVSVINHVIDWLSDGDGDGKEKLIYRLRRLTSVTTDFQPDSDAWVQFETEFGVFTDTVGEVMKQGYEVGKAVARRCSETILDQLAHTTGSALALMGSKSKQITDSNAATGTPAPLSRRASTVSARPSLPAVNEEIELENDVDDLVNSDVDNDHDKFLKLKEALRKLEADMDAQSDLGEVPTSSTHNQSSPWVANRLETEQGITHGPNPREWTRDAFMEAPTPESDNSISRVFNSVCQSLTSSFLSKTQTVLNCIQGSGMTPILGESDCNLRAESADGSHPLVSSVGQDENGNQRALEIDFLTAEIQRLAALTDSYFIEPRDIADTPAPEEDENGNQPALEIDFRTAEIQRLAALTDSYFIEPQDIADTPEPEEDCPPPPLPSRQGGSKTVMSINLERDIALPDFNREHYSTVPEAGCPLSVTLHSCNTPAEVNKEALSDSRGDEKLKLDESPPQGRSKFEAVEMAPALSDGKPSQKDTNHVPNHVKGSSITAQHQTPVKAEASELKMLEVVRNLQKFWPSPAIAMILTPEAQLQYAMNNYFEANGNQAEVLMSVAALKLLEKSKTGEIVKVPDDLTKVSTKTDARNNTELLEKMIQELRGGAKKMVTEKPAQATPSLPKPISKPNPENNGNIVCTAIQQPEAKRPEATIITDSIQVEVYDPKLEQTSIEAEPMLVAPPNSEDKLKELIRNQDDRSWDFVVANVNGPGSINRSKFKEVSSRLTRIPSRLINALRPCTAPFGKNLGNTAAVAKMKPFVFGKPGIPIAPLQRRTPPKIKVNTGPFPQPRKSRVAIGRPQTQPSKNNGQTAAAGSYASAFERQRVTAHSPRECSIPSLSRTNSYRQLFQIKQLISSGQPVESTLYAQSPNTSNNASSNEYTATLGQHSANTTGVTRLGHDANSQLVQDILNSGSSSATSETVNPNSNPNPTKKPAFYPF